MSNSLQGSIYAKDAVDNIISLLNSDIGKGLIYILVEGETDRKSYRKLFDQKKTHIACAYGYKGVSTALKVLNQRTKQIFAICDADFNHLSNIVPDMRNLFFTDFHDIEMTMLSVDGVLSDVLIECGSQNDASTILRKALEEAQMIGYIRWLNDMDNIGLKFYKMGLGDFIKPRDIDAHLDIDAYLNAINKRSHDKARSLTFVEVVEFKQKNSTTDLFNLCNGHDVTAVISLVIGGSVSHDDVSSYLRTSFNISYFKKTKLYADIFKWQTKLGLSIFQE